MKTAKIKVGSDPAEVYANFIPLAHKMAQRMAAKYPAISRDDHTAEALSILAELSALWNAGDSAYRFTAKVNASTWMWHNLYWFLTTYATRRQPKYKTFSNCPREAVVAVSRAAVRPSWWETLRANLGEDARVLATTLLNAPAELAEDLTPRRAYPKGKPAAASYMAAQGWSGARFEAAWWEVAGAL